MRIISRLLEKSLADKLQTGKIIILSGARQTGKTTLLGTLIKSLAGVLWLNGDEPDVQSVLEASNPAAKSEL